jgi:hypothetical protein
MMLSGRVSYPASLAALSRFVYANDELCSGNYGFFR